MASLFPNTTIPEGIKNAGEREVALKLCELLPSNVIVYHSYPWLDRDDRALREGEADFFILDPRYGIMVIEVKGGDVRYDADRSPPWYRIGGSFDPRDPYEQASKSLRYFEKIVEKRQFNVAGQLPFLRARMVVFPHTTYQDDFPPGGSAEITVDERDMHRIHERVEGIFQLMPMSIPNGGIGQQVVDKIRLALLPNFKLTPALWRTLEAQEATMLRLTEEQRNIVDTFTEGASARTGSCRISVRGGAGSGKTVLAMHLAYQIADKHSSGKVLFVCYNQQLAEWLEADLDPAYKGRIEVRHFHRLCAEWVRKAPGINWPQVGTGDAGDEFWREDAPGLLLDAIDLLEDHRYDAVVVDEGQDFESSWWDALELINARPSVGDMLVFFDPKQRLFNRDREIALPQLDGPYPLKYNCRNTVAIANYCSNIIGDNEATKPGAPAGDKPRFYEETDQISARNKVVEIVKEWLREPASLKPRQIAIISGRSLEKSCMVDVSKIGSVVVTRDIQKWRNGDVILLTSAGKFKGLEADAIVLSDVEGINDRWFTSSHAYVACSRAKHLLMTVGSKDF